MDLVLQRIVQSDQKVYSKYISTGKQEWNSDLRIASAEMEKHYGYDACDGRKIIKNVKAQPHLPEFRRMRNSGFNFLIDLFITLRSRFKTTVKPHPLCWCDT